LRQIMPNPAPFDSLGSGFLFSNIAIDENQALGGNLGQGGQRLADIARCRDDVVTLLQKRNDAVLFDKWWTYRIAAPWIVKTEPSARCGVLANAFKTLCEDFQISRPASKQVLAVGMPVRARPTPHPFRARCCRFFFP